MTVAVCILAKDEAGRIGSMLEGLASQRILREMGSSVEVHIVANGCTDNTATVARACANLFAGHGTKFDVHDLAQGGKSRTWNRTVHQIASAEVDRFVFCDADIEFVDEHIIAEMLEQLETSPEILVCAGYPVKNVDASGAKSVLDRLSLAVSRQTRSVNAISGQLYAAVASELREIWLPDETPGEDGFLNAMVNTRGFTRERGHQVIRGHPRPTHFYENLGPRDFVQHERRLIVGTVINRWIFEHLWSLRLTEPAGPQIRIWNETQPDWVERIIRRRAQGKRWLIPNAITLGRFQTNRRQPWWKRVAFLPLAAAATLMTIPPAISANRRLKLFGAATTW